MDIWQILYEKARSVLNPRTISPFIEAGSVGAAILTKAGNIYVGVCIDTASTLGAAILAGVGVGVYPDFEDAVTRTVSVRRTHTPNPENYGAYNRNYSKYLRLYTQLKDLMKEE